jgi:hypothetical protein
MRLTVDQLLKIDDIATAMNSTPACSRPSRKCTSRLSWSSLAMTSLALNTWRGAFFELRLELARPTLWLCVRGKLEGREGGFRVARRPVKMAGAEMVLFRIGAHIHGAGDWPP